MKCRLFRSLCKISINGTTQTPLCPNLLVTEATIQLSRVSLSHTKHFQKHFSGFIFQKNLNLLETQCKHVSPLTLSAWESHYPRGKRRLIWVWEAWGKENRQHIQTGTMMGKKQPNFYLLGNKWKTCWLLRTLVSLFPPSPLLHLNTLLIKNIFLSNTYREFPVYTALNPWANKLPGLDTQSVQNTVITL